MRVLEETVEKLSSGHTAPSPPINIKRKDEWGVLARALEKTRQAWVEKDRITMILGKTVSPQSTSRILSGEDFFALKGEKRECVILHLQFKGFDEISQNLIPALVVESLNQYFNIVHEIVFKYEGLMNKFAGDTAIAVWGAPLAQDDKEWRAAQASLEIQERVKLFNIERISKNLPPFLFGAGLHVGIVVSGNLGSERFWDYGVIGEPLKIAARLCDMAAPGRVVISAKLYEKIQHRLQVQSLEPLAIKNSHQPMATYEILQTLED
jgi:class 3 adenylate cyclase